MIRDVFDNAVPAEWRADLMKLIVATPHLSWLLVTKRIGNVPKMIEEAGDLIDYGEGWQSMWGQGVWPDNVRLLITVCNQEEANRDINKLLKLPCKNGVSYEPALEAVNFEPWLRPVNCLSPDPHGRDNWIEWLIIGGESGPKARPFNIRWARDVIQQCKAAGVPVFMKQTGSDYTRLYERVQKDRAGADPSEWPADLRVREFP
jgi:protein gp37